MLSSPKPAEKAPEKAKITQMSKFPINILKIGKDYGWPLCFGNKVYDDNFGGQAQKDDPCEAIEPPKNA